MRPRRPGFGRDLQQIAAAIVGTAAATQVIGKSDAKTLADVRDAITRLGGNGVPLEVIYREMHPTDRTHIGWVNDALEHLVLAGVLSREGTAYSVLGCCLYHDPDAEAVQCCNDCPDAQADEHTYQVPEGTERGATRPSPYQIEVVGANGRRLIAHRGQDGRVWVGGCEFDDMADLARFAGWLSVWAER